jgi:RNA polymerase sigma-70 factor (ECF subfamily)
VAQLLGELLERIRRDGDPGAVTTLVTRFQPWALDFARALLAGDAHLAEDAVQAAFVVALERLGDLRDDDAFPGWFRQILRTEAHRIARTRRDASTGEATDHLAGREAQASPGDAVLGDERVQLVHAALASLSRPGREAAELFYLEQLDVAEVAERLAVPRGTVKRRLHDARRQLRGLLLPYFEDHRPRHATPPRGPSNRPPL